MGGNELDSFDLCIPIYLNQQIVFDLLAIIEDGLSGVETIKTSSLDSEKKMADAVTGLSTILNLVGVSFGATLGKEKTAEEGTESTKTKVHTPSSLFSKLRTNLKEKGLVYDLSTIEDFGKLESGMFVEFKAILSKNPLVDSIEKIIQLMDLILPLVDVESKPVPKGTPKKPIKPEMNENKIILEKLRTLSDELNKSNSVEIIGKVPSENTINVVLSAKSAYFVNQAIEELIDGEYRILGKVIRKISSESEESKSSINLLRKTSFGLFHEHILSEFCNAINSASNHGIELPEIVTEIEGPAIQVIPITIFT